MPLSTSHLTNHLSEAVAEKIGHAESLYHRLVLVVGADGSGKTSALREIAECIDAPLINVSLELSRRLLDLTEQKRRIQVPFLLGGIATKTASDIVLLDNIELLFNIALHQNPLRLLQRLSRHRTVVATWNGSMEDGHIHYAAPGHPEYRRDPVDGALVAVAEAVA